MSAGEGPQDHAVFWGGKQVFSTPGLAEKLAVHQGLGGKVVTPSHFHSWVVGRQTAAFGRGNDPN